MKLLAATLFASYSFAQTESQNNENEEGSMIGRRKKEVRGMLQDIVCHRYVQNNPGQTCPYSARQFLNVLRNYGCNCYPDNQDQPRPSNPSINEWHMGSNGTPIDSLDQACLDLHESYRCVEMDRAADLFQDRTRDGCYKGTGYKYHQDSNGDIVCGPSRNPEYQNNAEVYACQKAICSLERKFAYQVADILADPVSFRQLNSGNYDNRDNICFKRTGFGGARDACCGEYPERSLYQSSSQECCNNSYSALIGSC